MIKDVRKIAKLLKSLLKDIFIEEVVPNIDPKQFGGRKKTGTEHMLVPDGPSAQPPGQQQHKVIMAAADWAAAFDSGDPTKTVG